MAKRHFTLTLPAAEATLERVRARLKLHEGEIDSDFGVVLIDPRRNIYVILLDEAAATRVEPSAGLSGPYSNPRIESFGQP